MVEAAGSGEICFSKDQEEGLTSVVRRLTFVRIDEALVNITPQGRGTPAREVVGHG
jgi:hypothetical protein